MQMSDHTPTIHPWPLAAREETLAPLCFHLLIVVGVKCLCSRQRRSTNIFEVRDKSRMHTHLGSPTPVTIITLQRPEVIPDLMSNSPFISKA